LSGLTKGWNTPVSKTVKILLGVRDVTRTDGVAFRRVVWAGLVKSPVGVVTAAGVSPGLRGVQRDV